MSTIENQREEEIIRWANYIKNHSDWKRKHTEFINAQITNANSFLQKLSPEKKEKLIELRLQKQ